MHVNIGRVIAGGVAHAPQLRIARPKMVESNATNQPARRRDTRKQHPMIAAN